MSSSTEEGIVNSKKVLGLIPARGGSKGIPGKNSVLVAGRPLVSWVSEEGSKSKLLDEVIISSDNPEIMEVSKSYGVRVPFVRPAELIGDETLIIDVIIHAVKWFQKNEDKFFDYVCLLQPTSPLGKATDYDQAISLAIEKDADTVISVYKCDQQHPAIMYTLNEEGRPEWFVKNLGWQPMARRQDLPPIYMRSGIVYVFRTSLLLQKHTLYGERLYAIEVPIERGAVDINSPMDLTIAEALIRYSQIKDLRVK